MTAPVEVFTYSIAQLEHLLTENSEADAHDIVSKAHRFYFEGYFQRLNAQTIIVEKNYTDRDFLDDFAEYYVKCFFPYKRQCTRLHFFGLPFSQQDFEEFLSGESSALQDRELADSYLGFIVVKPLPKTIIGRTCLKTYPSTTGEREFPITRPYEANVFGLQLTVKTLAFQEQDSVTAACATSALWSAFHGTGKLFQHPIPSPVEITKAATALAPLDTRTLPDTHGLTVGQMAHAIRSVSLEPFLVRIDNEYVLKSTLYAYIKGLVPVLMGIHLAREVDPSLAPQTHQIIDGHAVAVTGYNVEDIPPKPFGPTGFLLKANRINKIYAHDDQVGPFARMNFDGTPVLLSAAGASVTSLSWGGNAAFSDSFRAVPFVVLVPLYHKIRIPFERIHDTVVPFDGFIEALRQSLSQQGITLFGTRIEWDIYLTTVGDAKSSILNDKLLAGNSQLEILLQEMPRFLWRATAYSNTTPVLDLLFDATDIEQGSFFIRAVEYDASLSSVLRAVTKEPSLLMDFRNRPDWIILEWFKNMPLP